MRPLSITAAVLVFCCLGWSFYGAQTPNSNTSQAANLTTQQGAGAASSDVKEKIQKLSSANPTERAEAACALGEIGATAAIPALIKALGDDATVNQPVCSQKGRWQDNEINKTSVGEVAAVALSRIGRAAVEPLVAVLQSPPAEPSSARAKAAFALGLIRDERGIEPLIAATKDADWHLREKAVWSLGLAGDRRAVEPLALALKDAECQVRAQAAWALGLKGDRRAVEPLVAALGDENSFVQSQAAWALGLKGDERAVEPLTVALHAEGEQVRSQAAWALGLQGDGRAVEPLIAALKDASASVRSQAAWALGLKGDERAVEPLKFALNDADDHVRKQAASALEMRELRSGRRAKALVP